jgi:hypothetical protein
MREVFMIDVEKALLDPGLVFKTPGEVLANNELTRAQKIEILRRWEYDVRELQVADEEGMEGPEPVTLDAVLDALRTLGAPEDTENSAPTKQGGS